LKNRDGSLSAINVSYTNEIDEREISGLIEFEKKYSGMTKELILLTKDVSKAEIVLNLFHCGNGCSGLRVKFNS
jgi:hypothetical protein